MQRKVFAVGNSKGVSIPTEYLVKLDLAVGSEVNVTLDETSDRIMIEPVRKPRRPRGINGKFAAQVDEFIDKYKPALKELARK